MVHIHLLSLGHQMVAPTALYKAVQQALVLCLMSNADTTAESSENFFSQLRVEKGKVRGLSPEELLHC